MALFVSGFLAVYVLGTNPRGRANRAFFFLMASFVLIDVAEAIARALPVGPQAYVWIQFVWLGIALVPAALMHLALTYPEERPLLRHRAAPFLVYAPVLGWAYLIFATGVLIGGVSANALGPSARIGSDYLPLALLYAAWFYVAVGLFVASWWRVRRTALRRVQGIVVAGLLLGTVPAGVTEIFWPFLSGGDTELGLVGLYTLVWSVFLAFSIAWYRYLVIEPVTEPRSGAAAAHPVAPGLNTIVLEPGRSAGMGAFRELVSASPGLCVTGLPPTRVKERFGLERTPVVWVTNAAAEGHTVRPNGMDFELLHTILTFLKENPGSVLALDDVDYLASVNGFDAVARFLKRVSNQASAARGTVIAIVGTGTFAPEEMALLGGCVDRVLEVPESPATAGSKGRHHELLFMTAQDAPLAMGLATSGQPLVVTTDHPAKARKRFGEHLEVLWVTDHPEPGARSVRPSALDTEAKRALIHHAATRPGSEVLLVGLEQFVMLAGFPATLAFVKDALDISSVRGGRVIATLNPGACPPREAAMLARRFDAPTVSVALKGTPTAGRPTVAAGSRTPNRGPVS